MSVTFRDQRTKSATSPVPAVLRELLPLPLLLLLETVPGVWEELHLRVKRISSVTVNGENHLIDTREYFRADDMEELMRKLCSGSLYAFRDRINEGYITLPGGVRVGICGHASTERGENGTMMLGVREIDSLTFRFPHPGRLPGAELAARLREDFPSGALIYSPPAMGKTTLLRGLAVHFSGGESPLRTAVIDTREELDDGTFDRPLCLSLLSGYPKDIGIGIATRSLSAQVILCDEIGTPEEADAILDAANCGVPVIATAHGAAVEDLLLRPGIRALHSAGVFTSYIGIFRAGDDRSEYVYRITRRESLLYDC